MTIKNSKIQTPHDRYFRKSMSDFRIARDFFETNLPENIRNLVNLNTLRLCKESFVDSSLKSLITDMLFSVEFSGQKGYLYFLSEHESNPDKLLPFWLLKYIIAIMEHHLEQNEDKTLPVVYPIVYYNGKYSYPYSTDIFDLFGEFKSLAKAVFLNPFQIIDLTKVADEELAEQKWVGLMGLMLKHSRGSNILSIFRKSMPLIQRIIASEGDRYIRATLIYLFNVANIPKSEEFLEIVKQELPSTIGGKFMTLVEHFTMKGKTQGKLEGQSLVALNMLRAGISFDVICQTTELHPEKIRELEKNSILIED